MKIIGFVPARGGSTRIPSKNLKMLGEYPLFLHACFNLSSVIAKESIVVDSDDDKILDIAKQYGFSTLKRPKELSGNETDGNAFFRWETSNYPEADIYIQHLPPMPFLKKETLSNCINAITDEEYDSVVCVGKEHFYLWDERTNKPLYDVRHIPNSYILPETIFETMGLYVISREAHINTGMRIGNNWKMITVSKLEQVDINYPDDFEFAQIIERGLSTRTPGGVAKHIV